MTTAYGVGGGIASLSAAVFVIRDAGVEGADIRILEKSARRGGALDGAGDPMSGFVARGGRMLEGEAYECLWNLLETIPTLTDASSTVKDEIWAFNATWPTDAKTRLIGSGHAIADAADLGFDNRDRIELTRLLAMTEHAIGSRRIDEFFSPHFFSTHFWALWRTTFAFQNWHSAIELKRYLSARGVVVEHGVRVTAVDFGTDPQDRRVTRRYLQRDDGAGRYDLGRDDLAFLTSRTMSAPCGDTD